MRVHEDISLELEGAMLQNQAIGSLISDLREVKGWSQDRLAEKLGWPLSKLVSSESGENELFASELIDVAESLNINSGDFLELVYLKCSLAKARFQKRKTYN